jgi:hypothetical protein
MWWLHPLEWLLLIVPILVLCGPFSHWDERLNLALRSSLFLVMTPTECLPSRPILPNPLYIIVLFQIFLNTLRCQVIGLLFSKILSNLWVFWNAWGGFVDQNELWKHWRCLTMIVRTFRGWTFFLHSSKMMFYSSYLPAVTHLCGFKLMLGMDNWYNGHAWIKTITSHIKNN